jgi:Tol biopolymer transport system component
MALSPGKKLGPYEIRSPLGAGGMGEVYLATDTRLDRPVAIKILPARFSEDAAARQRFEREARIISSVSHPNICTLHDVGHEDGVDYLVMEHLAGETVAERLRKGPMPMEQVLRCGIEVCEGLEKAHRCGVVHRDLKPANIMLTKSGAKLMDFGLAKVAAVVAVGPASLAETLSTAALSHPITEEGRVVGTFHYMAPEQIEGKEADARSDIFALGAVLYEMATGKRAFEGKTMASAIATVLEREPAPISSIQPMVSPAFERLVRTCLAKDPDERWQTAHDVKLELEAVQEMGSTAGVPALVVGARRGRRRTVLALAIAGWAVAIVAFLAALLYSSHLADERRPVRLEIDLPAGADSSIDDGGVMALSPDGRRLAFPVKSAQGGGLWIRDLTTGQGQVLPGTEGAKFPFWSPDSRSVGFFANGKLRTIPAAGGPAQTICGAPDGRGGAWSRSGVILFTPNIEEVLYTVAEGGGTPLPLTKLVGREFTHRNPLFLPDSRHFLFLDQSRGEPIGNLYYGGLDGGPPRLLLEHASNVAFASGYLLYVRDRNLLAQRFDPGAPALSGAPVPVTENIEYHEPKDMGNFSAASNGMLAYRIEKSTESRFAWLRLPGKESEEFGDALAGVVSASVSPDGKKIAFTRHEPGKANGDLWIYDVDRRSTTRQTFNLPGLINAAFSPDSKRIAITASTGAGGSVRIRTLSTGAEEALNSPLSSRSYGGAWTPDGRYLLLVFQDPKTLADIYAQPLDGGPPIPLLNQPYIESDPDISPNGKWMAYSSNESGRFETYVTDFPGAHAKFQISSEGAYGHVWSRDGKRLYFANVSKLSAANIRNPETMELSSTETATMLDAERLIGIAPDGRLLVLKSVHGSQAEPIRVLLHFPDSLQK